MGEIRRILTDTVKWALPQNVLIVRGAPGSGSIALTYDDGPHPRYTRELLAVLRREGVRATFFLNGEPGRRSPELVQQIACEGHELGNHLYYHRHIDRMSYREFSAQVEETAMLIAGLTGRTPRLIRPPYGKVTSLALLYALRHKTPIVLWSLDTEDSEHDLGAIRGRILRHRMRPGDIVLMHDDYHHVVQLTQLVLAQARLAGMGFATVSELTSIPAR